jgi:hypothetical protein
MNMSAIATEPKFPSVFSRLTEVTEIRDAKGNILGVYTPKGKADADECREILILFEDGAFVKFDIKKARERLTTEKAKPFREMIGKLEKLAEKKG